VSEIHANSDTSAAQRLESDCDRLVYCPRSGETRRLIVTL
jgi:hypothetical protein